MSKAKRPNTTPPALPSAGSIMPPPPPQPMAKSAAEERTVMAWPVGQRAPAAPRFIPVVGDSMAPALPAGSFAAVVPVHGWCGDGVYAVQLIGEAVEFVRISSDMRGGVRISRDNGRTGPETVTADQFLGMVLGKVAARCDVMDRNLLPGLG